MHGSFCSPAGRGRHMWDGGEKIQKDGRRAGQVSWSVSYMTYTHIHIYTLRHFYFLPKPSPTDYDSRSDWLKCILAHVCACVFMHVCVCISTSTASALHQAALILSSH